MLLLFLAGARQCPTRRIVLGVVKDHGRELCVCTGWKNFSERLGQPEPAAGHGNG